MKFVLSGEGPTDIGTLDYYTRSFLPGPMAYFIDNIVVQTCGFSFIESNSFSEDVIHYYNKRDLRHGGNLSNLTLPGKKTAQGNAYFTKSAYALGIKALDVTHESGLPTIAVLYKDADPSRSRDDYEKKRNSITNGFERAGFHNGVPMIPRQIMEAWLLDSLDWQGQPHKDFEAEVGGRHSDHDYKNMLQEKVGSTNRQKLVDLVRDGTFDQNRITVQSYQRFRTRLMEVLESEQH